MERIKTIASPIDPKNLDESSLWKKYTLEDLKENDFKPGDIVLVSFSPADKTIDFRKVWDSENYEWVWWEAYELGTTDLLFAFKNQTLYEAINWILTQLSFLPN